MRRRSFHYLNQASLFTISLARADKCRLMNLQTRAFGAAGSVLPHAEQDQDIPLSAESPRGKIQTHPLQHCSERRERIQPCLAWSYRVTLAVGMLWLLSGSEEQTLNSPGTIEDAVYTGDMCKNQSQIFGESLSGPIVSVPTVPSPSQLLKIILSLVMIQDNYKDRGNSINTQKAEALSTSVALSFL